ncbi:vomeronasal type-1 receptor 4-like [Cervus canadensis]|uniref:vomeronasal type-1 receptor 4-like n=1 Tax=Cervus canadensis TaxID=1574408 RepID=UPI001CA37842|nr:vomeronasal type-1 receptor 4-like [Cervus canadensis]
MAVIFFVIGTIILTRTVVGLLGNFSLLCSYIILHFMGYRLRSTDLILKHLIVANPLVLLSKGVPHSVAMFGWKQIHSDFGCKLLFFLHRVGRGVPIGSICLSSVFQVITISPWNSRWAALKVTASKYTVPSIFLCWILQMLVNVIFPIYITGKCSDNNITEERDYGCCSTILTDQKNRKTRDALYAALLLFPDVLSLGLTLWAGGSVVLILYRHKQQVQQICRTNASSRSSPVSRATKTILLPGSTFFYFSTLSSIFQILLALFDQPSRFLVNMTVIIAACFPAVSPFLLMSCDSSVCRLYFDWMRNTESFTIMRNL